MDKVKTQKSSWKKSQESVIWKSYEKAKKS